MPTEHEYKYAVSMKLLEELPEDAMRTLAQRHQIIEQGYLAFSKGMSCRVRSTTEYGKVRWYLTFKQKVSSRVIEIEKKLDERDGCELWEVAVGKLKKDRYVFESDGHVWEVDVFKHDGQIYFLLAEVELAEGQPRPKRSPDFLRKHVLYEVPLSDDRFSNKKLSDVNYARQLYQQFSAGDGRK